MKKYEVDSAYRTIFYFNDCSYIAILISCRDDVKPGSMKMIRGHQGITIGDAICLSYINDEDIEKVKYFQRYDTSVENYELVGLVSQFTEDECQRIMMVNPSAEKQSYYGNGKKVFHSAKSAMNSFFGNNRNDYAIIRIKNEIPFKKTEEELKLEEIAKFMGGQKYFYQHTSGRSNSREYYITAAWIFPEHPRRKEYSLRYYKSDWNWLIPAYSKLKKEHKKSIHIPKDKEKAFEKAYGLLPT